MKYYTYLPTYYDSKDKEEYITKVNKYLEKRIEVEHISYDFCVDSKKKTIKVYKDLESPKKGYESVLLERFLENLERDFDNNSLAITKKILILLFYSKKEHAI